MVLFAAACGSDGGKARLPADTRGDILARAGAGEAGAQFLVGYDLCCGDGGAQGRRDIAQATVWLCRAAHQGEPRAQYNLALIYAAGLADSGIGAKLRRGIGGGKNPAARPALAAMWFDLAMAGGHPDAPQYRIALGKNMSAADHLAAEKLRGHWRNAPCEWQAVYGAAAAR